ncbi:MAG TPA: hypothetical protein VGB78_08215 [Thermoplasmata archaeon]
MSSRRLEEPESSKIGREYLVSIVVGLVLLGMIAVIVLYVFFSGLVPGLDSNDSYHHTFVVEISAPNTSAYEIIVPVPADESLEVPAFFEDGVEVATGTASVSVVDTEKGIGLKITGSGYAKVQWDEDIRSSSAELIGNLTMTTVTDLPGPTDAFVSWFYANRTDVEISFSYQSIYSDTQPSGILSGGGPSYYARFGPISEGWFQEEGDYHWMVFW